MFEPNCSSTPAYGLGSLASDIEGDGTSRRKIPNAPDRIGRFGGDGPIRPTLQKTTNATERARNFDNNIEDRNIRSAEQVRTHISVPIFLS